MNKLELLEKFDKEHNGSYTVDDLAELIVEAYRLGEESIFIPVCKPEQAVQRVRDWATQLQEIKPQNGFMDMNGAGNYLLYLIGDIEKPNDVTPELKTVAARKLWKILESEQ